MRKNATNFSLRYHSWPHSFMARFADVDPICAWRKNFSVKRSKITPLHQKSQKLRFIVSEQEDFQSVYKSCHTLCNVRMSPGLLSDSPRGGTLPKNISVSSNSSQ